MFDQYLEMLKGIPNFTAVVSTPYQFVITKAMQTSEQVFGLAQSLQNYAVSKYKTETKLSDGITLTQYPFFINVCTIDLAPNTNGNFYDNHFLRYEIGDLLNTLDNQKNGRAAYGILNSIAQGPHLLADTTQAGIEHRNQFLQFLKPKRFFEIAHQITVAKLKAASATPDQEVRFNDFSREIICLTIAKVLFDLDELPEGAAQTLERFSEVAFSPTVLSVKFPSYETARVKNAKVEYRNFAIQLFDLQKDIILNILQNYDDSSYKNKNFIAEMIIANIKHSKPEIANNKDDLNEFLKGIDSESLRTYLNDAFIFTIPSLLITADNISKVINIAMNCLIAQGKFPDLLRQYQEEHFDLNTDFQNIINFDGFKKVYQAYLYRSEITNSIPRYTKDEISIIDQLDGREIQIPGNTIIEVLLKKAAGRENLLNYMKQESLTKNKSILFSSPDHRRACPGFMAARTMFYGVISAFTFANYEFREDGPWSFKVQERALSSNRMKRFARA